MATCFMGQKDTWSSHGEVLSAPTSAPRVSPAPPREGGAFSGFFNAHVTGRGIEKPVHYFPAYQRSLAQFIGRSEVPVVEVGVESGGSLEMWRSVLGPGARLYGVDVSAATKVHEHADERTWIFVGDQADPRFWAEFRRRVPRVDILIDDGGHTPEQQITTFGEMFAHLSPGGVYITEDIFHVGNPFWRSFRLTEPFSVPSGGPWPQARTEIATWLGRL